MAGILESTVYLSVTAVFILLFKWIFKNKLSAKWHVLIWLLLALRLVLPSLPESSFSIFNAFDISDTAIQQDDDTEDVHDTALKNDTVAAVNNNTIGEGKVIPDVAIDNITDKPKPSPVKPSHTDAKPKEPEKTEKPEKKADATNIVKTVIYTGSALIFLYFVVIYVICIRKNAGKPRANDSETMELLEECKKRVGVKRRVYIVSDGDSPMLMGIVKPTIILPDIYTKSEKKDILVHELCHLKSGDIYLLWLAMIVLCLNWYNPIMWVCFFMFRRDVEVYCDERVLKYVDSKKDYAALLVKTALKKNSFIAGTTSLQNGEKEVERRVKYMAYFKKPHYTWTVVIAVIAAVIGVLCLTNPKADDDGNKDSDTEKKTYFTAETEDEIYNLFLENKVNANINNGEYSLTQYIESRSAGGMKFEYTFFDMNGDGTNEFHIRSPRCYDIFTVNDGNIELWYEGSPYENFTSDGNIFYCRYGGAPNNERYIFKELDSDGNVVSEVSFSVYNPDDTGSITLFYNGDGEEISEDEYYDLKNKYDNVIYDYDWFVFYDNLKTVIWENINEEKQTDITIQYPAFYGMTDELLQDKINAKINQAVFEPYLEMSELTDDFNQTSWHIDYTVEYISDRYISVVFNGYIYTMGAAHGTDYKYAVTVDLATGEKVNLSDIFDDSFVDYLTFENFGECIEIDFSGAFSEATDLIFTNIREEFERDRGNLFYDYFHFANDGFHITHAPQNAFFCFTADYESLKGCMKDHPLWQELGVETQPAGDYSEVYDKQGTVLESSKNFYLEDRTDKYYFEVYGNDGRVLLSSSSEKCPVFIHLDGPIYELRHSYGTFAWKSSFFDVERGTISELFDRPFYLVNTVIARVNSNDYYDESLTNKMGVHTNIVFFDVSKEHLENIVHSVSADFLNESTSYLIEYVDDTHICVTYYTKNGSKENKKILEVPSFTKMFSLTYNGFTFDLDTTIGEITSVFPTSERWEEPENYSFIAGSPVARRISFAYPDHKAPKVRVICIENLETGHSFIERIIVYDENAVTVLGENNVNSYNEKYGLGTVYDLNIDTPESRAIELYQKEILAEISAKEETKQPTEIEQNNFEPENLNTSEAEEENIVTEKSNPVSIPEVSDDVTDTKNESGTEEPEVIELDNEITIAYETLW